MITHLQVHTHYSLLEGIGSPKAYIQKAKEYGMSAIGMTDYNGLYGAVEFYQTALAHDIKPIIGVELFCVHDASNNNDTSGGRIILLAENNDGYQDLLQLVSFANMDGFSSLPRIDFSTLQKHGKNLLCIIGGERSIVGKMILENDSLQKQVEIVSLLQKACGDDSVYCSILAQNEQENPTIKNINSHTIALAKHVSIPVVVSQDVHYLTKEDQKPFEVALSIKDGKRIYDEDRRTVSLPLHFSTEQEIIATLQNNGYDSTQIDELFQTVQDVTDRCNCEFALNQLLFPNYESPEHIKKLYETHLNDLVESS